VEKSKAKKVKKYWSGKFIKCKKKRFVYERDFVVLRWKSSCCLKVSITYAGIKAKEKVSSASVHYSHDDYANSLCYSWKFVKLNYSCVTKWYEIFYFLRILQKKINF
jgi:hypothetical protein